MTCDICNNLSIKQVQAIDRHLTEGKRSLLAIANHYNIGINELRNHMITCAAGKEAVDEEELLRSQRQLSSLICQLQEDVANGEHLNDQDGDGRYVINNLLSALRELRETILARHKIRTSDEVYHDLRENVVDPLIHAVVAICIDETRRLREEIFDITRQSAEQHPKIKKAVDEMLERVADRMGTEATHDIPDKVKAVVGKKTNPRPASH